MTVLARDHGRLAAPTLVAGVIGAAGAAGVFGPASDAAAAAVSNGASASATGTHGELLTTSQATGLSPAGQRITVTGTGYDTFKGIYVAVCKVPTEGELPTPCGGGVDTTGASQTSAWVSSNPPSYGKGLAVPYGKGGTFSVTLWSAPQLPDGEDCRQVECAVVTRADHTRTSDRSMDVLVPVTFAGAAAHGASTVAIVAAGVFGALLVAIVAGVVFALVRRRRSNAAGAEHGGDAEAVSGADALDAR